MPGTESEPLQSGGETGGAPGRASRGPQGSDTSADQPHAGRDRNCGATGRRPLSISGPRSGVSAPCRQWGMAGAVPLRDRRGAGSILRRTPHAGRRGGVPGVLRAGRGRHEVPGGMGGSPPRRRAHLDRSRRTEDVGPEWPTPRRTLRISRHHRSQADREGIAGPHPATSGHPDHQRGDHPRAGSPDGAAPCRAATQRAGGAQPGGRLSLGRVHPTAHSPHGAGRGESGAVRPEARAGSGREGGGVPGGSGRQRLSALARGAARGPCAHEDHGHHGGAFALSRPSGGRDPHGHRRRAGCLFRA